MVTPRFIKIFYITVLVTLLVSSVEPATNCPSSSLGSNSAEKDERFVILLKSEEDAKNHFKMMNECYQKINKHVRQIGGPNALSTNRNTLVDFSTNGKDGIYGYSALFKSSFAEQVLANMEGVDVVEKDSVFSLDFAIPQNLIKRAEDEEPQPNDDRIDQSGRPLDGKFVFPDSAGKGVNIYIVDTGIRITHKEFEGRARIGGSFCEGCNDKDEDGHGTQVASIAAGKFFGVARKANLVAVRVFNSTGGTTLTTIINGLSFVLDQHKEGKNKNSVVNLSLGGPVSKAFNKAVKSLTDAGVHVVVSAGNDGQDACNQSPAAEPSAITVGATDELARLYSGDLNKEEIAFFSNIGKCVDLFAPGVNILGAGNGTDTELLSISGTSQAAPHVAGTLALLIAKDGNKSPAQLAKDLVNLSTKGVIRDADKTDSPNKFLRVPTP